LLDTDIYKIYTDGGLLSVDVVYPTLPQNETLGPRHIQFELGLFDSTGEEILAGIYSDTDDLSGYNTNKGYDTPASDHLTSVSAAVGPGYYYIKMDPGKADGWQESANYQITANFSEHDFEITSLSFVENLAVGKRQLITKSQLLFRRIILHKKQKKTTAFQRLM